MNLALWVIVLTIMMSPQPERRQGAAASPRPAALLSPVVQTCAPCHGVHGEGKPEARSPRIAGQSSYYLARQLDSYAAGTRTDPTMESIANGLSPELRAAVAAHYAQADAPATASGSAFTARWVDRGRVLATSGDPQRGVQACANCHGPDGIGQPPTIPYLAGLDDGYIRATLTAWKDGRRSNDAGQQMAVIAKALSSEDVASVARYYAGATPPKPASQDLVQVGRPQLLAPDATRAVTVDTSVPDRPGAEGRAATAAGNDALGQSGKSDQALGANNTETTSTFATKPNGQRIGDRSLPSGDAARGRAIVADGRYGCTACHVVPGIRSPRGIVGPSLGGLADRPFIAGQLPNRSDVLVAFLRNPPSLVPATGMPNVGLGVDDARDVAAYLYTLPAQKEP